MSAGESSGDLHGANLIEELKRKEEVTVDAVGGARMERAGARLIFPMEKLSVVGLSEGLLKLPALLRAYFRVTARWRTHRPDLFIPIDFPGFNLRLARSARSIKIPVMYYVAPQVWAWGAGRIETIKRVVDTMAVVLPFEEDFFKSRGVPAVYVGHPLVDRVGPGADRKTFRDRHAFSQDAPLVGLLPGSRWHEVSRLLPVMLRAFKMLKKKNAACQTAIGLADAVSEDDVRRLAREVGLNPRIVKGGTYDLIEASDAVVAASGTVTLEAALLATPMVVLYKMSPFTYAVARRVVKTDSIGLVNIVAGGKVVPEYVQDRVDPSVLREEIESLLFDPQRREKMLAGLEAVRKLLGEPGAPARAAELALETAGWRRK